jgi:hypothetical protein
MALDSLSSPGAVHLPWARWAQPLLGSVPDLSLVMDLLTPGAKPSYLMPVPDDRLPDLSAELSVLRAEAPRDGDRIASVLRRAHEVLLAPHWERIVAVLEADVAHQLRRWWVGLEPACWFCWTLRPPLRTWRLDWASPPVLCRSTWAFSVRQAWSTRTGTVAPCCKRFGRPGLVFRGPCALVLFAVRGSFVPVRKR